ncbi:hypothetical protein Aperf_G00000019478 [Anoplocephala perfoliata]
MTDWNSWRITYEDRCKHDERFQLLRPVNGFITGEQARNFFTQSKLPTPVLANIWALADLTADGQLDRKEFSIAMYLIKKSLEGNILPRQLPLTLLQEPQRFIPPVPIDSISSPNTSNSGNGTTRMADSNQWSISSALQPKYKLQFNQNDRNKRGYLTGVEARGIFLKSNLPQSQLAAIWNLADVDKDGNLTCEEFCIAAYLIDQVLAGRKLPPTLPPTLNPTSAQQSDRPKSTPVDGDQRTDLEGRMTFEDKRMQNFLLGQAELDKRKQDLAEQVRQEEEQRLEQARLESEKQEKLRCKMAGNSRILPTSPHEQERERERQRQLELEVERARAQEARRQEAATARLTAQREELRRLAADMEASRVAALVRELARQSAALEAARAQATKRASLSQRLASAQAEVAAQKAAITGLAGERDTVERECQDLAGRLEAARAEINHWQREQEQIQRQLAPPPSVVVDITNTTEQQKTLRASLKVHRTLVPRGGQPMNLLTSFEYLVRFGYLKSYNPHILMRLQQVQESKRQLETQLCDLETEVLRGGQRLASHRHTAEELAKKRVLLATEVNALLATLLERRRTLHRQQQQQRQKEAQQQHLSETTNVVPALQNDVDAVNSISSTALDAGPSEMYTALYAYTATRSDELTFVERDKIQIFISPPFEVCEGWLYGEMGGKRGLVPACYVKKSSLEDEAVPLSATVDPFALPDATSAVSTSGNTASNNPFPAFTGPENHPNSLPLADDTPTTFNGEKPLFTCLALYDYETNIHGDLKLQINDKVDVFVDNNGWYEGVSQRTGQRGLFPANYVQKLQFGNESPNQSGAVTQASAFTVPASLEKNVIKSSPSPPSPPPPSPPLQSISLTASKESVEQPKKEITDGEKTANESEVIKVCDTPELAVVVTPFTARSSEQLSLTLGQYVKIRVRSSKGWWEGETQQRGQDRQIGWFPADYVRLVNANNSSENQPAMAVKEPLEEFVPVIQDSSTSEPVITAAAPLPSESLPSSEAKVGEAHTSPAVISTSAGGGGSGTVASADLASATVVQSMFAYKACQPDEMTFPEGALIDVLAHEEEGWWRGRIQATGVQGLFPVNYVKPYHAVSNTTSATTTIVRKPSAHRGGGSFLPRNDTLVARNNRSTRLNVILELIDSEKHYLTDLVEVKEVGHFLSIKYFGLLISLLVVILFLNKQKFYEGLKKQGVSERRLAQIFGNWDILCEISEAINKDFQERKPNLKNGEGAIGDILVRHLPKCMAYRDFCANQDDAMESLRRLSEEKKEVVQFMHSCEHFMRVQAMPLSSYFLKPMQRITKYKLLIEKLLKHTPSDHPDYENLEQSLELVSTVLVVCNEAIRNRESFAQIFWLRDHLTFDSGTGGIGVCSAEDRRLAEMEIEVGGERRRRLLLYSGTLYKVKSGKELTAFLFTDMLLLTQPINIAASSLPSGNVTLPQKPDAAFAKVNFKAYKHGISLAQIRVTRASSASPKQRRRSVFRNSRASITDISSIVSGGGYSTVSREMRTKRRSLNNLRPLSFSLSNLNGDTLGSDSATFLIVDDCDSSVHLLVRAPSENLRISWMEAIQKASVEYQRYLSLFRNPFLSDKNREALFAAVLDLTVVSASGLPMVGPSEADLPWPYCEVSLCLRCKRTNVILSTRSPKWNCSLRFMVKDLTRDVVTINVYSKSASSFSELIGKTEVGIPEIVEHCWGGAKWKTALSLTLISSNFDDVASIAEQISLEDINVGPEVDPEYAAWFNIVFWFVVAFALVVWAVAYGMWNMDPCRDGIIYRMSVSKPKTE